MRNYNCRKRDLIGSPTAPSFDSSIIRQFYRKHKYDVSKISRRIISSNKSWLIDYMGTKTDSIINLRFLSVMAIITTCRFISLVVLIKHSFLLYINPKTLECIMWKLNNVCQVNIFFYNSPEYNIDLAFNKIIEIAFSIVCYVR